MSDATIRVCLVDDDALLLAGMQRVLRRTSPTLSLNVASSGEHAIALLETQPIDVLVSDLRMPGMDGQSLMAIAQSRFPDVARVVVTGALDPYRSFDLQLVAHRVLAKPIATSTLTAVVHELGPRNQPHRDPADRCSMHDVHWPESAALRLREQGAKVISADVARDNPWLAILLLQAGNAGFVSCGHPLDVQTAVRALGPQHLSIMFERLQSLPDGEVCADCASRAMPGHRASPPLMLAMQARETARSMLPRYAESHADAGHALPALSSSDFVAVAESAALLRAASPLALLGEACDRDLILRTAWGAARMGVPAAIVEAVRESAHELTDEHVSVGAAVRQAFALVYESAANRSALS